MVVSSSCTDAFSSEESSLSERSKRIFAVRTNRVNVRCKHGIIGNFIGNSLDGAGKGDVKVDVKSSVEVVASDVSLAVFAGDKRVLVSDRILQGVGSDQRAGVLIIKEASSCSKGA